MNASRTTSGTRLQPSLVLAGASCSKVSPHCAPARLADSMVLSSSAAQAKLVGFLLNYATKLDKYLVYVCIM